MSLLVLRFFPLCQMGISTGKLKMYTIDSSKYCAKNQCNTMITTARRQKYSSNGANRPSDITITVNSNANIDLIAVKPIIECFSGDLVDEYCHSSESSRVYIAPPSFVKSLPGCSNRSLPHLLLHMHAETIIPPFLTSNIDIGLCLSEGFILT